MKKRWITLILIAIFMIAGAKTAYAEENNEQEEEFEPAEDDYDQYRNNGTEWDGVVEGAKYAVNGKEQVELGANYEKRRANISEYMSKLFTDGDRLALYLRPSMDIDSQNEEIIKLANTITDSITDEYEKVKAIHDWVSQNIYYDKDGTGKDYYSYAIDTDGERIFDNVGDEIYSQNASYVLKVRKAVCEGYTNLTVALLRAIGIPANLHSGYSNGGLGWGPHAWTVAYIRDTNEWIILDTTFDSGNTYINGKYVEDDMRTTYFDPTTDNFAKDHYLFYPLFINDHGANIDEAERYGAKVDFTRTDLYFYFKDEYVSKYSKREYSRGIGIWDKQYLRFETYSSWVSSNPEVATVNQYGEITAHEYGTTTISLAYLDEGKIASFVLHVEPREIGIWCSPILKIGESYSTIISQRSDESVELNRKYYTWSSSNEKVATVDKNGKVTAVGKGTAEITVKSLDGKESAVMETEVYPVLTGIKLTKETVTMKDNETFKLNYKCIPADVYRNSYLFEFDVADEKILYLENYGDYATLTGLKKGSTTVTLNVLQYDENGDEKLIFSDSCKVTVKEANRYKISFKANGGTAVKSVTVKENSTISNVPSNPTKKNYTFTGWYKDSKYVEKWDFKQDKVTKNITLYAGWQISNPCYVTYYTEMDNIYKSLVFYSSTTAVKGNIIKAPKTPTKKGYTFIGWYDKNNNKKWDFKTNRVSGSIILVAKFKKHD